MPGLPRGRSSLPRVATWPPPPGSPCVGPGFWAGGWSEHSLRAQRGQAQQVFAEGERKKPQLGWLDTRPRPLLIWSLAASSSGVIPSGFLPSLSASLSGGRWGGPARPLLALSLDCGKIHLMLHLPSQPFVCVDFNSTEYSHRGRLPTSHSQGEKGVLTRLRDGAQEGGRQSSVHKGPPATPDVQRP